MKKRYKYALFFVIIHILITLYALNFNYNPSVTNGDLGLILMPNILIPVLLFDRLPDIFGYWSNIYFATIFWILFGFIIGLIAEGLKKTVNNIKVTIDGQNRLKNIKNASLLFFAILILTAVYFIYRMENPYTSDKDILEMRDRAYYNNLECEKIVKPINISNCFEKRDALNN